MSSSKKKLGRIKAPSIFFLSSSRLNIAFFCNAEFQKLPRTQSFLYYPILILVISVQPANSVHEYISVSFSLMSRTTVPSTRQVPVWCPMKTAFATLHWEPTSTGHAGHRAVLSPTAQHRLPEPRNRIAPRKRPWKIQSASAPSSSPGALPSLQHSQCASSRRPAEASWGPQISPRHPLCCLTAIQKWHQISEGWWGDTQTVVGMTESAPSCCRLPRPSKYLALPDISLCSVWYLHFASLNFN